MAPLDMREFSRIDIDLQVILTLENGITILGYANDLALKGLRLATECRAELGSTCSLTMLFGDQETGLLELTADGIVVRHEAHGMAIEFTSLDLDTHDHLRNLILAHASDSDRFRAEFDRHLGLNKRPNPMDNQGGPAC